MDIQARIDVLQVEVNRIVSETQCIPQPQVQPDQPSFTVNEALDLLKRKIKEEMSEWEDREMYGKIGKCSDAEKHLIAIEKFFEDIWDDDWMCTLLPGDR